MEPEKYYHIYTHANGTENLFREDENFRFFLQRYEHFVAPVADTLAWCLMPNHLHALVRVKPEAELQEFFSDLTGLRDLSGLTVRQFSHLFNAYTKAYNKRYQRRGSLFTRAFKRKEITNDRYFTQVVLYIHANPIRHGFTKEIQAWRWSSYHDYLLVDGPPVCEEVLRWFGSRTQFIQAHQQPLPAQINYHD